MAKVTLVQVIYNGLKYIPQSFDSMMSQTFRDINFVAVICGDEDGGKEYIAKHYPQVEIIDLGENAFFARPHNIVFKKYNSEFFQLVNQDLILKPDYIEKMLEGMEKNPQAGAATGKLLKYDFVNDKPLDTIDTTGVNLWSNGRAADRGQNQKDTGKYDQLTELVAVSGAGPMYRRSALEDIKMPKFSETQWKVENGKLVPSTLQTTNYQLQTSYEYFDEDFVAYWEDVDLSLRLQSRGWECIYVPNAIGYHGRTAASTEKDYADVSAYKQHHEKLSSFVKQMNYKNHIFLTLKNIQNISWKFFVREFFMLGYLILLERSTLKILPIFFKQLPVMWKKRQFIRKNKLTNKWTRQIKTRGIISLIDEEENINQAISFKNWVKEFFRLMRLIFKK